MKVVNFRDVFTKGIRTCVVNGVSVLSLMVVIPAGVSHAEDAGMDFDGGQGEAGADAGFDPGAGFGADPMAEAGVDAGFGAASGFDAGAGAFGADQSFGGAEFPPEEAQAEAQSEEVPDAAPPPVAIPVQAKLMDAASRAYFDELEDALLLGDLATVRKVCQSKQGGGCGAAKNFLSACTLFLREEEGFGVTGCIKKGSQNYKINPEGFVYPANPQKNKPEVSALDHLIGQMKESGKKLAPEKAKFLRIVCTSDALSMLENKDDKRDMQEACLEFKYHGNPPPDVLANLNKGAKKRPRPTIFADKESPDEDGAPVKRKKATAKKKAAKGNDKAHAKEEVVEAEKADNEAAEVEAGAVVAAEAVPAAEVEVEAAQPVEDQPGQVIGAPKGNQPDFGKALQAGQGMMGQFDTSGAGQKAMQDFSSFTSGLKGGAASGGFGGFGGGEESGE